MKAEDLKQIVKEKYGKIAEQNNSVTNHPVADLPAAGHR